MRMDKPTTEPAEVGNVDIEALSRNVARLIEEGGKALAAYLKPREEGKIKDETLPKTSPMPSNRSAAWRNTGCPIPRRALELQTSFGRAYLDLWAGAVKRMAGEQTEPVDRPRSERQAASPTRSGRKTSSSISSSRLICSPRNGPSGWSRMLPASTSIPARRPNSTSSKSPMRFRRRTSYSPIRNCCARRLSSNAENLVRGMHMLVGRHQGRTRHPQDPPI